MLSLLDTRARVVYRWLRKRAKRGHSLLWLIRLTAANRWSKRVITGDADVIVSLTTFGDRVGSVASTVETIGTGAVRARRVVLWLDDADSFARRPASLRRLEARGLEVRLTENLGPHTKYFPVLDEAVAAGVRVATADDDILYPRWWLDRLLAAADAHPDAVSCYRASIVALDGTGVARYDDWPRCTDTTSSITRFATGVSGVLYPLAMLEELRRRGTAFVDLCLKADDIWLHWVALRAGIPIRQIDSRPRHFPLVPGTQAQSLMATNVAHRRNDAYVAGLYDEDDVAALAAAGAPVLD